MVKGKKLILDVNKNFKTNVSVVNINNPSVVHLNITSWVGVVHDIENEESFIRRFNKEIKQYLYSYLNNHEIFKQKYIVDLDMSATSMKNRGKCFFECDITLIERNVLDFSSDEFKYYITNILKDLIKKVFYNKKEISFNRNRTF